MAECVQLSCHTSHYRALLFAALAPDARNLRNTQELVAANQRPALSLVVLAVSEQLSAMDRRRPLLSHEAVKRTLPRMITFFLTRTMECKLCMLQL